MDTSSLANVDWSPAVNSRFQVIRLETLRRRRPPDDHDPFQPHRLRFHALILFTQGQGTHGVDFAEYAVKAGTLIHICANQIHHFGNNKELEGFLVIFLPAALPTNLLGLSTSSALSWTTVQYVWPSVTSLHPEQAQKLQQHIELLETYKKTSLAQQPAAQYLLWSIISLASQAAVAPNQYHSGKTIEPRFLEFVELWQSSVRLRHNRENSY